MEAERWALTIRTGNIAGANNSAEESRRWSQGKGMKLSHAAKAETYKQDRMARPGPSTHSVATQHALFKGRWARRITVTGHHENARDSLTETDKIKCSL